jgi:hypothetical protein
MSGTKPPQLGPQRAETGSPTSGFHIKDILPIEVDMRKAGGRQMHKVFLADRIAFLS